MDREGSGMVRHSEGPTWNGAVAAGLSLLPSFCVFCGLCKLPWSIYVCPSRQVLPLLWTSGHMADHRKLGGHRQLPGRGEWHCCLQQRCLGSLSAGRPQVPLRASPASWSTWRCSACSFPYHGGSNLLISETGKFFFSFSFYT